MGVPRLLRRATQACRGLDQCVCLDICCGILAAPCFSKGQDLFVSDSAWKSFVLAEFCVREGARKLVGVTSHTRRKFTPGSQDGVLEAWTASRLALGQVATSANIIRKIIHIGK